MRTLGRSLAAVLALPLVLAGGAATAAQAKVEFGQLLAKVEAGVPKGCRYKARVFAVAEPEYARKLLAANRRTAPFVVVDRINVFEDEVGTHVALVNPESVNRTVLMDDGAYAEPTRSHLQALRSLLADAVAGKASEREFGEKRSEGCIGRTMGVMAGGRFTEKIQDEAIHDEIAGQIKAALGPR